MTAIPIVAESNRAPRRRRTRQPKTLRVAIAGCGVVGGALVGALVRDRDLLVRRRGLRVDVVRVLVRDPALPRPVELDRALLTTSPDELLAAEADVVVEAIGGIEPALQLARATLARGARFVTANKALVAAHGRELAALARRHGGALLFDAAVGGGVPVLRILHDALGGATPRAVRGILNGTSNFVLTQLERGASLDAALDAARARGLAEADATRDLDGRDAADKLAIIAWTAFGVAPETVRIRRRGLLPDAERLVRHAARLGGRVRLVADCELGDDGALVASVEPAIVDAASALGRTLHEENHVSIETGWTTPLVAAGPGAGGSPTAAAALSDILAPTRRGRPLRTRRTSVRAADDDRALRWTIGAACDPLALAGVLRAHGLDLELCTGDARESLATVGAARWSAVEAAIASLEAANASPTVARLLIAESDA